MADEEVVPADGGKLYHFDALLEVLSTSEGGRQSGLFNIESCWIRYGGKRYWAALQLLGSPWGRPGTSVQGNLGVARPLDHRGRLVRGSTFELLVEHRGSSVTSLPELRPASSEPTLVARGTVLKVRTRKFT